MSNPLELPFGSQSTEPTTNNHQHVSVLHRCSKPSRWQQPPRVTRKPQPQQSPSVTRYNHSSKYTRNHSQSHFDDESRMEMSERCLLRLTRMSSLSKCQERAPSQPWSIYRPLTKIQPLHNSRVTRLIDRTQPRV
jgi:hypothetical protein